MRVTEEGCKIIILNMWDMFIYQASRDRRVRDRIVVGFITTYVISAYHY